MRKIIPILSVSDVQRTLDFYTNLLGFTVEFTMPGEDGAIMHASLRRGDAQIMFGPLHGDAVDHRDHLGQGLVLYMELGETDDVDGLYFQAKATGCNVVQEPTDQFWGCRDWGIADPDGYLVFVSKETRSMSPQEMMEQALVGAPAD